jgi:hypothetical protein
MKTVEISDIDEMILNLPEEKIQEVRDYVAYLLEKERKRKSFEERVLKAAKEPSIEFETVEDAVKAIFDEAED